MDIEQVLLFLFCTLISSVIVTVVEIRRETKAFQKWLKDGRWKYEKFNKHL